MKYESPRGQFRRVRPGCWGDRGNPSTRSFGDYKNSDDPDEPPLPAVWQTYRATWEIFQPDQGSAWNPPIEFNGPRPAPEGKNCPGDDSGYPTVNRTVLTQIAKSRVGGLDDDVEFGLRYF